VLCVAEAPPLPVQETVYSVVEESLSGAEPTWVPDPIRLPLPVRVQEVTPVQFQFKVTLSGGTIEPDGLALREQDGFTHDAGPLQYQLPLSLQVQTPVQPLESVQESPVLCAVVQIGGGVFVVTVAEPATESESFSLITSG